MRRARRWNRTTVMFVVGASLMALCVAALRLGLGTATGEGGPAWWLAAMFLVGAGLLMIVLVQRILAMVRKP
ncbi:hypothetical protein E8P82_05820 [Arthrobacter echini]|uniref:Uncharacterized protein n=1 Tax=Arthrobacter echini TaxID=1529066 RepID=A0A4S5E612_9MICC|nr:hypothetical protein [Arthrobacter echini]THJ66974.1 hypothetical protein E8P82_05820 [Arthrobacter echini]